ncbi:30S ribosomal protein S6 [Salmonirosea aquatica]|uniref:Small ribosomal subunit protein bS6 n=1 Tax=Salmonirosea aquatica TaxID=2654236 RepID=A0A7C9FBP2_9BACT|nr:30S ribosomal protein S6 [Cytophagaceae bacterium SJW1-29]
MNNQYETVFILTPILSEAQVGDTVDKFRSILTENGAELVHEENWGLRKLAYPIQKKSNGFYHLIEYKAPGTVIDILETAFRRDERIMRFLTVALDKHAVAYNEKKRKGLVGKKKEQAIDETQKPAAA